MLESVQQAAATGTAHPLAPLLPFFTEGSPMDGSFANFSVANLRSAPLDPTPSDPADAAGAVCPVPQPGWIHGQLAYLLRSPASPS